MPNNSYQLRKRIEARLDQIIRLDHQYFENKKNKPTKEMASKNKKYVRKEITIVEEFLKIKRRESILRKLFKLITKNENNR